MTTLSLAALLLSSAFPALAADASKVSIAFWQRGYVEGGTEPATVTTQQAVRLFEDANPDVKVGIVGVPYDPAGDARVEKALLARDGVDIVRLTGADLPKFARRGVFADISPWLTAADRADFLPGALDAATYKGKTVAWPLWVTAITVLANTDLLAKRGVAAPSFDSPWSFSGFAKACRKLSFAGHGGPVYGLAGGAAVPALFYIDGGRVVSKDGTKFTANDDAGVSAVSRLAELHKNGCLAPDFMTATEAEARARFKAGTAAMLLSPPGWIRTLAAEKFPFAVLPLPIGKLGKPVTTGGFGLYAAVDTGDKARVDAAQRLARWLTGSEVGAKLPGYQLAPGLRASNKNLEADALFVPVAKAVRYGVYEPPTDVPDVVKLSLVEAMRRAVLGEAKPKAALDGVAAPYQAALDESLKP